MPVLAAPRAGGDERAGVSLTDLDDPLHLVLDLDTPGAGASHCVSVAPWISDVATTVEHRIAPCG
jgi:hypothetical protein